MRGSNADGAPAPEGFADPWEHVRLLSDPARNDALIGFLARHAPGRRVLEVGCGTGVLSAVAARLGAREVLAVEVTPLARVARELMYANGLSNVEVIEADLADLEPRPRDLVFSELLNADPFAERVVSVSRVARAWLAPGGLLAPSRLRVWAAAVRAEPSETEASHAARELASIGQAHGLDLGPVRDCLAGAGAYRTIASGEAPAGRPVLLYDLALGEAEGPADIEFSLPVGSPRATGVMVWFEAPLDDRHLLHNRPGSDGHWGQQVHGFGRPLADGVRLRARVRDGELTLERA